MSLIFALSLNIYGLDAYAGLSAKADASQVNQQLPDAMLEAIKLAMKSHTRSIKS